VNSWAKSYTVVDRMRRGKKVIVPGDGSSLWVITHNSDFAKGLVGLLGHEQAIGHAFHITSDEVMTWDQFYRIVGAAAGVDAQLIHIPSDFIAACMPDVLETTVVDARTFDVVVSSLVFVLGLPLWLAIALAVKLTSPGPVLYTDRRIGLGEREFGMLKFRTMYADAAAKLAELHDVANTEELTLRLARVKPQVVKVLAADGTVAAFGAVGPDFPIGCPNQARPAARRFPPREHRDKEVATPIGLA